MKKIFMLVTAAFTIFLSACSFDTFEPIPSKSTFISTVNIKDMTISFYDLDKDMMLPDWKVDRPYVGGMIFPNKDTLLLYGNTLESVDLYSLSKGKKIESWETGKGIVNGMLVHNGSEIAFADQERDSIRFYSLEGKEIKEIKTERDPLTILEAEDEQKLYVMSFNHKMLSIIDLENKEKLPGFEIHAAAAGGLLNQQKGELWIGGHGKGTTVEERIHVYDLKSGKLKKEIAAAAMPVNFIKNKLSIYVLSHGSNMLYQLGENGEIKASIKVGANPFEIELFDNKLFIAGYDSNDLYIVNPDNLKIEKTVSVGKGPFQIVTRER
ncbi:WD40 repeat domain-containing protein [Bacillus sp. JJ1609]|uniref:YncE family protein n=1 Tax=Bacillus sp. JJ1609 TaxID=3122977 RepID=UPI002FFEDB90